MRKIRSPMNLEKLEILEKEFWQTGREIYQMALDHFKDAKYDKMRTISVALKRKFYFDKHNLEE